MLPSSSSCVVAAVEGAGSMDGEVVDEGSSLLEEDCSVAVEGNVEEKDASVETVSL